MEAGETLGVVGPTGAGKSTLINLVGRLFETDSGTIRLDGHDVRALPFDALRGTVGYVPQDSFLFSETYEENIRFGADHELTDAEVDTLIERVAMKDEVACFLRARRRSGRARRHALRRPAPADCIARALARASHPPPRRLPVRRGHGDGEGARGSRAARARAAR